MREIMFRGYNKEFDGDHFVYGETILFQEYRQQWVMLIENELGEQWVDIKEPQQYTGIKDKKGKEVYEGDIIHLFGKGHYDGVDYNGCIQFLDGGFCATDGHKEWGLRRYDLSRCDLEIEVIGNIYENLHLLD